MPILNGTSMEEIHLSNSSASFEELPALSSIGLHTNEPQAQLRVQTQPRLVKREACSKEQWEAIKPVIHLLYNVENKPYRRVVEILRTEHSFFLTRRQFYRKISEWGFEKNIKEREMRDIVQSLDHAESEQIRSLQEMKAYRASPAKILRWQKKHRRLMEAAVLIPAHNLKEATQSIAKSDTYSFLSLPRETSASGCEFSPPSHSRPPEKVQTTPHDECSSLTKWQLVDVPGSPDLSRFFEALNMECPCDIPCLSLDHESAASAELYNMDADMPDVFYEHVNPSEIGNPCAEVWEHTNSVIVHGRPSKPFLSSKSCIPEQSYSEWSLSHWDFSTGLPVGTETYLGPLRTLSPFPVTATLPRCRSNIFGTVLPANLPKKWEMDELGYKHSLKRLKRILGPFDSRTLNTLDNLAQFYHASGKYQQAERLYKESANYKERAKGFQDQDTLCTYLNFIKLLDFRGKWRDAIDLHQRVHGAIVACVGPEHTLALRSTLIMANRLADLKQEEQAEVLWRQTLQICLTVYGLRHGVTLDAMRSFACCLSARAKLIESERLLDTVVQLQREVQNVTEEVRCYNVSRLALSMFLQKRYAEARVLSIMATERSRTSLGPKHGGTLYAVLQLAKTLIMQEELEEGETLLRKVLSAIDRPLGRSDLTLHTMHYLGYLLCKTGRHEEALKIYEYLQDNMIHIYGLGHWCTMEVCDLLGQCYEKLGRYQDAFSHYERTAEKLKGAIGEQHSAFIEVRGWITSLLSDLKKQRSHNSIGENTYRSRESCREDYWDAKKQSDDCRQQATSEERKVMEEDWMDLFDFEKLQEDPEACKD